MEEIRWYVPDGYIRTCFAGGDQGYGWRSCGGRQPKLLSNKEKMKGCFGQGFEQGLCLGLFLFVKRPLSYPLIMLEKGGGDGIGWHSGTDDLQLTNAQTHKST